MEIKFKIGDKVIINAGYSKGEVAKIVTEVLLDNNGTLTIGYSIARNGCNVYYFENELLEYNNITKVLYGK